MSPSTAATRTASPRSAPTGGARRSNKVTKPSLIVKLSVPPALLARITSETPSQPDSAPSIKSSTSPTSTPVIEPADASPVVADNLSESNATPAPAIKPEVGTPGAADEGSKKKGAAAGLKPPARRAPASSSRSRARPGARKRARLDDGTNDLGETGSAKKGTGATHSGSHRLGPKANQGAINAGLRALDRTGKPCRRWEKKGFQLKSFTGVTWHIPTWRSPKPRVHDEAPARPEAEGQSQSAQSEGKENKDSVVLPSEKSSSSAAEADLQTAAGAVASSPAPLLAASA